MAWASNELERLDERLFARFIVNASWLIKLRWVAVTGQFATMVLVSQLLAIDLPASPLAITLLVTSASNVGLTWWFGKWKRSDDPGGAWRIGNRVLALVMMLDLITLTAMLYLTGGPNNPFSLFYFVNLSLCAVVLSSERAWALTLVSMVGFCFLLVDFIPLPDLERDASIVSIRRARRIHLSHAGLSVAFATCASVIVYFMTRLNHELRATEMGLWKAESGQARNEKLQALGTLAAGAAHELSTPLTTIAVVARELEHEIKGLSVQPELVEEIELIRAELDRCRLILDRMNAEAGQASAEGLVTAQVADLIEDVLSDFTKREQTRVRGLDRVKDIEITIPRGVLVHALRGLLMNAIDASNENQWVDIFLDSDPQSITMQIQDKGHGMDAEILRRVSEPFFTTKDPGKGMGLGLFLTRTVIEQLGGELEIQSTPNIGTDVFVRIPRSLHR